MTQTKLMRADEVAVGFNSVNERQYWKAAVAGTRINPEVHFNSRASMVRISYRVTTDDFTVTFSRVNVAFGDFMASTFRSLAQVMACLKAAGLPFAAPVDDTATLRIEYDPRAKVAVIHIGASGDGWLTAEPLPFKVPVRPPLEPTPAPAEQNTLPGVDSV
jgi:hypothetical protein